LVQVDITQTILIIHRNLGFFKNRLDISTYTTLHMTATDDDIGSAIFQSARTQTLAYSAPN